jgi:hypothetical protein
MEPRNDETTEKAIITYHDDHGSSDVDSWHPHIPTATHPSSPVYTKSSVVPQILCIICICRRMSANIVGVIIGSPVAFLHHRGCCPLPATIPPPEDWNNMPHETGLITGGLGPSENPRVFPGPWVAVSIRILRASVDLIL